jgi:predicted MFS family arabinose efflux permease
MSSTEEEILVVACGGHNRSSSRTPRRRHRNSIEQLPVEVSSSPMRNRRSNDNGDTSSKSESSPVGGTGWSSASPRPKNESLQSLLTRQSALCSIPVLVLVVVASLDNADKQLLASSFVVLERTLHLNVKLLGYFSLFTNLSYALSLPLWGFLVHRYPHNIHTLLAGACASWGLATIGIAASGSSLLGQATFRALNGVALGSILPLSQTILVELVEVSMRGRAFGFMGLCEKLAGTIASASIVYWDSWQKPYYIMGVFSILVSGVAYRSLTPARRRNSRRLRAENGDENETTDTTASNHHLAHGESLPLEWEPQLTLPQIILRIAKIPAFTCLVAQGVFGGTPWDMMSFMILLLDWRGFTKDQIVMLQVAAGASSTVGGWLGGMLGDYAHQRAATYGRIFVALVSVAGGIPLYGLFLFATDYQGALLWVTLFNLWAAWTPPAALRPICADLTRNPSERAQIISMWIVLEKASGAIFGAPLVGYLTSSMLPTEKDGGRDVHHQDSPEKAHALAYNLFVLSSIFWTICAIFWVLMAYTWKRSGGIHLDGYSAASGKESASMMPLLPLV